MFGVFRFDEFLFDGAPTSGALPISGGIPLAIDGFSPTDGVLSLFIATDPASTVDGAVTFVVIGHVTNPIATSSLPLVMWSPPQAFAAPLNLYVGGTDSGARSLVMNLVVAGGNPSVGEAMPLVIANDYTATGRMAKLYVGGLGTLPGAVPISESMNLYIERGPNAGITLYVANNIIEGSTSLFVGGRPTSSGEAPLFVEGFGGTSTGSVTLAIPNVVVPTPLNAEVTLAIPQVAGTSKEVFHLYVNGWRP